MILGGILIFFLTGRIWNIHIEGNVRNSTGEILDFLDKQDINHGMSKKKINCSEVAAAVRKNFPEITWVSARIEGTRLILNIQEGIIPQKTNSNTSPCNLLADKDGVITDMIVRRGIPVKKPGDSCKKGELLVSGELHIMNDSQEVLRKEYVHADADIFISRQISYYQEFPLKHQVEETSGQKSLPAKRKKKCTSGLGTGIWDCIRHYIQVRNVSQRKFLCVSQKILYFLYGSDGPKLLIIQ